MVKKSVALQAALDALAVANAAYMAERTPEARAARDEASRAVSALTPTPARSRDFSPAARSGRRQYAERIAASRRAR